MTLGSREGQQEKTIINKRLAMLGSSYGRIVADIISVNFGPWISSIDYRWSSSLNDPTLLHSKAL